MLELLEKIERDLIAAITSLESGAPTDAFSGLIQAQIDLRRQIARLKREAPTTGFLEAFTAALAEIEQERNRWQDLRSDECLSPTAAYRLGCRRGLRFALQAIEPLHERLQDQEARHDRH